MAGNRRFSLRLTLISVFTSVVLLGFTVTLEELWRDGRQAALASAQSSFAEAADLARQHVGDLFAEMLSLAHIGAAMPGAALDNPLEPRPDEADFLFLRRVLATDPGVYATYIGRTDGSFVQAIATRDARIIAALDAPLATTIALRSVPAAVPGVARAQGWAFLDAAGSVLARRIDDTGFDPRPRAWFTEAMASDHAILSAPYLFASTARSGITAARRLPGQEGVFAIDVDLSTLNRFVDELHVSAHGHAWLLDDQLNLLAGTGAPDLLQVARALAQSGIWHSARLAGADNIAYATFWDSPNGRRMVIAVAGPTADFAVHVDELLRRVLPLTVAIMLATLLATVLLSRLIAGRLAGLMRSVDAVRQLDFAAPPPPRSAILELDLLGQAMALMQQAIGKRTAELEQAQSRLRTLVELGIAMGAERDVPKLAGMALEGAVHIAGASGGALFLRHGEAHLREVGGDAEIALASDDPLARALRERRPVAAGAQVAVPLRPLGGEVIGAMRLATAALPPEEEGFVEALAASAAAALDNRRLLEARDALLDALISLIAGAIDAKSPYTGGHCRRVPELAVMLAEAADGAEAGPLAPFRFAGPEEWREFRVAAWLHDCGKVATPEYVVDKATKLETLYNRIHEIRTRFEVLWRDAEIASLRRRLNGTSAMAEAAWLDTTLAELRDDYVFVAGCNLGAESMSAADLARLAAIAERSWQRHFSDRLGLSMAEQQRLAPIPEPSLPAAARLLEDRPDHVVPRDPAAFALHATLKFALPVPRNQFDFGELRNLSIRHGTLTEEERFIINEHVLHSIAMLESLPLPKELRRVPEFAGTHHETLDGTGYPRRLGAAQLAVPSRIMAIADIFEALTASDRPYRPAKRLSEALAILQGMVGRGKLDADLYALFLAGGVCRRYAERFLRPEQIDLDLATLGLA